MIARHVDRCWMATIVVGLCGAGVAEALAAEVKPVADRVADRDYPSIHMAWNSADNLADREDKFTTMARHDIMWIPITDTGLLWNDDVYEGLSTSFLPESIPTGMTLRVSLMEKNPNLIVLGELRFRDAWGHFFPPDHPWWKRDEKGEYEYGWKEGGYVKLDYAKPGLRKHLAVQAKAAVDTGVFDGIFLDWWNEDDDKVALLQAIREALGPDAIIVANANWRKTPRSAPHLNGIFMECARSYTRWQWEGFQDTLVWAEQNLREPRTNCLETWWHNSRDDLRLMRATTTLSLVFSDGYCLFADPNDLPAFDHLHDWYSFWDEKLGRPDGDRVAREDGSWRREFTGGTVVYNPMYSEYHTQVRFQEPRRSAAAGVVKRNHVVGTGDGDLFMIPTRAELETYNPELEIWHK